MSSSRSEKERLISSWPRPIARWTPRWLPYKLLRLGQSITMVFCGPFLYLYLIYVLHFGDTDMWGVRRDRASERQSALKWKQHKKEEAYWRPTALSPIKKRRFYVMPEWLVRWRWWGWGSRTPPTPLDQQQSPLGRLPEELRQLIFAHLLAGRRLHIQDSYKRCGSVECTCTDASTCGQVLICLRPHMDSTPRIGDQKPPSMGTRLTLSSYDHLEIKPESVEGHNTDAPHHELLALAKTCRLLSSGYLDALYTNLTLSFTSLRQFQNFSATIPPHRLNRIVSLEFHSELQTFASDRQDQAWEEISRSKWRKSWEVIADMERLRSIHVDLRLDRMHRELEHGAGGVNKWMEDRIFDPMRGVRQAREFEVVVNWRQSRRFVLGPAPFTLERREDRAAWSDGPIPT
jgi:hypothetical protein